MNDPRYVEGVELFRRGDWFEAHEVLELAWRAQPKGPDREFLQGLIQFAVSLEHWRRGNPRGARGQYQKGGGRLRALPARMHGLELGQLVQDFDAFYAPRQLDERVEAQMRGEPPPPPEPGPWPTPRWSDEPG